MTHGSLFSGIGGFDLAAQWMGWNNAFHCEINPFCRRVLGYYWPEAISYEDIKKTDFTIHANTIDILSGGFPCQPYSTAGKRLGKEDERHLWPEMLRAIREIRPGYVVGENVRGLTNWNGGMVFDEVQADLEAEGYEVLPFLLPAASVNAPHRRDRIWFVAYSGSDGHKYEHSESGRTPETTEGPEQWEERDKIQRERNGGLLGRNGTEGIAANSSSQGFQIELSGKQPSLYKSQGTHTRGKFSRIYSAETGWKDFPTQSPVCGRNDGLSLQLDGITLSKWRNESIKGYGNAIVPQVAFEIFKVIQQLSTYQI